jgi:precorrin-2/cobalt-factor-2 C20-methyltransferase
MLGANMNGILYGVGVGPGDPKLMTCLAVETIRNCQVLAVPSEKQKAAVSYKIASGMVENLDDKECLYLAAPMTKEINALEQHYQKAAEKIIEKLQEGKSVAYLTLGDPTIYSTYIYIHRLVVKRGFQAQIISGVPSFCAAAAALGDSLTDRDEEMHIIPASYDMEEAVRLPGTKVFMKAGSRMSEVKQLMQQENIRGQMVENCGMSGEKIYHSVEEIPEKTGYYTVIICRD